MNTNSIPLPHAKHQSNSSLVSTSPCLLTPKRDLDTIPFGKFAIGNINLFGTALETPTPMLVDLWARGSMERVGAD